MIASREAVPTPDSSIDVAQRIAVLRYVPREVVAVKHLLRALKPGDSLLVVVDSKSGLSAPIDIPTGQWLRRRLARGRGVNSCQALTPDDTTGWPARTRVAGQIRAVLTQAGLIVDEETTLTLAPTCINGTRLLSDAGDNRPYQPETPGYRYICRCHRPA